jgi:hypothetical protein
MMLFRRLFFPADRNAIEHLFANAWTLGGRAFMILLEVTNLSLRGDWLNASRGIERSRLQGIIAKVPKERRPPDAIDLPTKMLKTDFRFSTAANRCVGAAIHRSHATGVTELNKANSVKERGV